MIVLGEGFQVGDYRVSCFIKEGLYNSSYRVVDEKGVSYFMKFYDKELVPEKLLVDGVVLEVLLSRRIKHRNVISYIADGKVEIEGKTYCYLITEFFHGSLLSEVIEGGKVFSYQEVFSYQLYLENAWLIAVLYCGYILSIFFLRISLSIMSVPRTP